MKNLYECTDYRQFLKHFYLTMKEVDPTYSYQKFSLAAELKSANYLKLIIDGDRDLTVSNIHQFAKALKLTESECEFFESLVLWNQADTPLAQSFYRSKMLRLKAGTAARTKKLRVSNLGQFPYLPAIVVAGVNLNAQSAPPVLAKRFGLPVLDVKRILDKLVHEEIFIIENGLLTLTAKSFVQFDKLKSNKDQKSFLKAQLELSNKALQERYATTARFFAHTFTTSEERLPEAVQKIAELLEELTADADQDPPEKIMQLNIQFFPLD